MAVAAVEIAVVVFAAVVVVAVELSTVVAVCAAARPSG